MRPQGAEEERGDGRGMTPPRRIPTTPRTTPAMNPTIRLGDIAHGRSGDKGNHANVALIAWTPAGFEWMKRHVTKEAIARHFAGLECSRVERFEAPNLNALNFMLYDALAGGASQSLRSDNQGKTYAQAALLMEIPAPPDLQAMNKKN